MSRRWEGVALASLASCRLHVLALARHGLALFYVDAIIMHLRMVQAVVEILQRGPSSAREVAARVRMSSNVRNGCRGQQIIGGMRKWRPHIAACAVVPALASIVIGQQALHTCE